jgi:hypothetical protein
MPHHDQNESPDELGTGELEAFDMASEKRSIVSYVEDQADEKVLHAEKATSQLVGPARHDIWDVHCAGSRWWAGQMTCCAGDRGAGGASLTPPCVAY